MENEELIAEVESLRSLMIAVATGGPRIDDVNAEYKRRRLQLSEVLAKRGLDDQNPYRDLWEWYGKWSSDFPKWQQRRAHLIQLFEPLIDSLSRDRAARVSALENEPTGWVRVDRAVDKARHQLDRAKDEEDFQQVGLLCREILISLAQGVYNPEAHETVDGKTPSSTDANRMLEACVQTELSGSSNEAVRRHARASLSLANDLQHRRTASYRDAALCLEATFSVVNIFAIILGRQDHAAPSPIEDKKSDESRQDVIERLNSLSNDQREALRASFSAAHGKSGSHIFAWTVVGGGLDPLETYLMFLLDEEAIVKFREEQIKDRETTRWYRFKSWLFDYIEQNANAILDGARSRPVRSHTD